MLLTPNKVPHVVYHAAGIGNWQEVVREQMLTLRESGLASALKEIGDEVRITHVGSDYSREEIVREAARHDVPIRIVRTDHNISHYETFAMLEIEKLAKIEQTDRPIIYHHTKGVSNPGDTSKWLWRHVMTNYVIHKWQENLQLLDKDYDAVGFNWWGHGEQHFSGTFWMATANWIRQLPDFVSYHHAKNLIRYSCELWIGAQANPTCRAYSWGTTGARTWDSGYNFTQHLPSGELRGPTITWVTAATPKYVADLSRLQKSFGLLGPGHQLHAMVLPEKGGWRQCIKLNLLKQVLPTVKTSHVFWIDADCEFQTILRPSDFIDETKPLTAVDHFAFNDPKLILPDRLRHLLPKDSTGYKQACLWGGTVEAVSELLEKVAWIHNDERGYDEHALNIEWFKQTNKVHTLPSRYAAPAKWNNLEEYRQTYLDKYSGEPRVLHHNREVSGS